MIAETVRAAAITSLSSITALSMEANSTSAQRAVPSQKSAGSSSVLGRYRSEYELATSAGPAVDSLLDVDDSSPQPDWT